MFGYLSLKEKNNPGKSYFQPNLGVRASKYTVFDEMKACINYIV